MNIFLKYTNNLTLTFTIPVVIYKIINIEHEKQIF